MILSHLISSSFSSDCLWIFLQFPQLPTSMYQQQQQLLNRGNNYLRVLVRNSEMRYYQDSKFRKSRYACWVVKTVLKRTATHAKQTLFSLSAAVFVQEWKVRSLRSESADSHRLIPAAAWAYVAIGWTRSSVASFSTPSSSTRWRMFFRDTRRRVFFRHPF